MAIIAAGIYLWAKEGDQGEVMIAESAIKLLEASSEPKMVLEAFVERVAPSSWTGSRANIMQARTDALCGLMTHVNTEVSEVLKPLSEKLHGWIKREQEREQREDEKLEQRFE